MARPRRTSTSTPRQFEKYGLLRAGGASTETWTSNWELDQRPARRPHLDAVGASSAVTTTPSSAAPSREIDRDARRCCPTIGARGCSKVAGHWTQQEDPARVQRGAAGIPARPVVTLASQFRSWALMPSSRSIVRRCGQQAAHGRRPSRPSRRVEVGLLGVGRRPTSATITKPPGLVAERAQVDVAAPRVRRLSTTYLARTDCRRSGSVGVELHRDDRQLDSSAMAAPPGACRLDRILEGSSRRRCRQLWVTT